MDDKLLAPKRVLDSFPPAFLRLKEKGLLTPALAMEELDRELDGRQRQVVERIMALRPQDYGVDIPFIGIESVPPDLVSVKGQHYKSNGEEATLGEKLVPSQVYDAFKSMSQAFKKAYPNRALLIESAYRSPASQIITFINWCSGTYSGEIASTIRHASPPAYSQHTSASKTAIDILNIDGQPNAANPEAFRNSIEYKWLRDNADEYGFYESWKEGNRFGMRAEPWHWQYLGPR